MLESVLLKSIKITLQCLIRFIKISTYTTCESQRGEHAARKVKTTEDHLGLDTPKKRRVFLHAFL